mmetsp:Transcript_55261/g.130497  ORF Transcript_55261/g.130497 Transcript_55261/m.130497 type:complete len:112 (+) Transcript_55261:191-526(+)
MTLAKVLSREHIESIDKLEAKHLVLLEHMAKVGKDALRRDAPGHEARLGPERYCNCLRFGFHVPPFISVRHLHMHCLALPFQPFWQRLRFTPFTKTFATIDNILQLLSARR